MNYRLEEVVLHRSLRKNYVKAKGYTYGIGSSFIGSNNKGPFTIYSTIKHLWVSRLIKEIVEQYGTNFNENDLNVTKGYLIKSNAREFETMVSKLNMLYEISNYNFLLTTPNKGKYS
jgi:zinc protease